MIGKIVKAGAIPTGFVLKTKGVKESVYADILQVIAGLQVGQAVDLTQDELETKMGKALPKFFKANLRKKLVEKFTKGGAEMVVLQAEGGDKVIFQIAKMV